VRDKALHNLLENSNDIVVKNGILMFYAAEKHLAKGDSLQNTLVHSDYLFDFDNLT
jgi:hypothetical protein